MIRSLAFVVALLTTGCAMLPDADRPFTVSKEAKEFCGLLTADTDAGKNLLLRPYGNPDRVDVKTMPNKHAPDTNDEVYTAHYRDGRVVIYSVPHIGRNYLLEVVLTDKFWPERLPRLTGKSRKEIIGHFGEPNQINGNDMIYYCTLEADQYIQLHMALGRLVRLEVKGWVD
jgi:hypothetical protein